MRRPVSIAALAAGVIAGVGLLLWVGVASAPLWLPPLAHWVSGGKLVLRGLSGRMPDRLRLAHLELRDRAGVWAAADGVALDWSPLALLAGRLDGSDLLADHMEVVRAPLTAVGRSSASVDVPSVRVRLGRLHVTRLDVGAALARRAAVLTLDGDLAVISGTDAHADVRVQRLDSPGRYALSAAMNAAGPQLELHIDEPAQGLLSELAGLPALGPLHIDATLAGPFAADRLALAATAGALTANAAGVVDIKDHEIGALDVTVRSPAMAPAAGVSWRSIDVTAHASGAFAIPAIDGTIGLAGIAADGASITALNGQVSGRSGSYGLDGSVLGLVLPGQAGRLFANAPVLFKMALSPRGMANFSLSHPLLGVTGSGTSGAAKTVSARVTLPDLAPFGAVGNLTLRGWADFAVAVAMQGAASQASVDGTIGIDAGPGALAALVGGQARLSIAASKNGGDITLSHLTLTGQAIDVSGSGSDAGGKLDLSWRLWLTNLKLLASRFSGDLQAQGTLSGPQNHLDAVADVTADLGIDRQQPAPLMVHVELADVPAAPAGKVTAQGSFDGSPLSLDTSVARDADGGFSAKIAAADWRSLHAAGALTLAAGAKFPAGDVTLSMGRLADVSQLIGQPVAGGLQAALHVKLDRGTPVAMVDAKLRGGSVGHVSVAAADVNASITNPATAPSVTAAMNASGIAAGGSVSSLKLSANGRMAALDVRLATDTADLGGARAVTNAAATLNLTDHLLRLSQFDGGWHGEMMHLNGPATLSWAHGMAIDRLALGVGGATVEVAGTLTPALALRVSARNVTPELAQPFAPDLQATGALEASATVGGTLSDPSGHLELTGSNLRDLSGSARVLAPASLRLTADFAHQAAMIDARVAQAANRLKLSGTASAAALDLAATGRVDLAVLDPILLAQGRRMHGEVVLDATITGTPSKPQVTGTARLTDGELQDYGEGVHLTDMTATLAGDGQTIRIADLSAKAGTGTITASGTIGVGAPQPVAIELSNHNAEIFASDRMTAVIGGDLMIGGSIGAGLEASGNLSIDRAELRLPEQLPVTVASIEVIRPGETRTVDHTPALPMKLAVGVKTRDVVFVRGRGVDAELTGDVRATGDLDHPIIIGAFDLRRGSYTIAGTTLDFTSGTVSFDGGHGYDPALDFVATNTTDNVAATLTIGGYASKPKITLSSVPDLPQDEILSRLLFSSSVAQLSPFQIAEIGSALASIGGLNAGMNDPLETARKAVGLDRLTVNGGDANTGPTLEGGRYVARGVYVGAKQGASSSDTTAEVRIDITKQLKLETDVGNSKDGSNIGLSYQFEY